MKRPRPALLFGLLFLAGIGVAVMHELTRERAAPAEPVTSPLPVHPDEIERLEGGFEWTATRGGRPVFQLDGNAMVRMDGGVQLVRGVERLSLFLEDGRSVVLSAERGRLRQISENTDDSIVRLEGNVVIEDPDGTVLSTEILEYDSARGELRCVTPTRVVGPLIDADVGSLVYRPDSRVIEGLRTLVVRHGGARPWNIDTSGATYRMTTGELVFDRPLRIAAAGLSLLAGGGVLIASRDGRPATFRGDDAAFVVERFEDGEVALAAAGLTVSGGADGPSDLQANGPASVVVSGEGEEGPESLTIASGGWRVFPGTESQPQRVVAGPGYTLEGATIDGPVTVTGGELTGFRDESGRIGRLEGSGGAELSGPEETSASGSTLSWGADVAARIVLLGEPAKAARGRDTVEAPRIEFDRLRGDVIASEGILAELRDVRQSEGALFSGDEPVRVRASSVRLPRRGGQVVFEGPVQAWQEASTLRAESLRYGGPREQLVAEGSVDLRVDRPGPEGTSTLRLRGERLDYSLPTRVAVVSGPAHYEEEGVSLDAEVMSIHLAEGSELERLVATNSVRLVTEDAIGRADRLEWEGGSRGEIVLIGEREVASLRFTDGERTGTLRVGRLRYDLETGAASVDQGPGRGTLESTPTPAAGSADPNAEREGTGEGPR